MDIDWAEAIREKRAVKLEYEPGLRIVEPHAYGYSRDGNLLVRAFQIEGESASGVHKNWKLFRIDRVGSAIPSGTLFDGPRAGYKLGDPAMKGGIIEQLLL